MDRESIFEKLQSLICETLEVDEAEVTEDVTLDDLGADSFDKLELITALEEEFDCVLPDEVLEQITTISDAIDAIVDHQ